MALETALYGAALTPLRKGPAARVRLPVKPAPEMPPVTLMLVPAAPAMAMRPEPLSVMAPPQVLAVCACNGPARERMNAVVSNKMFFIATSMALDIGCCQHITMQLRW